MQPQCVMKVVNMTGKEQDRIKLAYWGRRSGKVVFKQRPTRKVEGDWLEGREGNDDDNGGEFSKQ